MRKWMENNEGGEVVRGGLRGRMERGSDEEESREGEK